MVKGVHRVQEAGLAWGITAIVPWISEVNPVLIEVRDGIYSRRMLRCHISIQSRTSSEKVFPDLKNPYYPTSIKGGLFGEKSIEFQYACFVY